MTFLIELNQGLISRMNFDFDAYQRCLQAIEKGQSRVRFLGDYSPLNLAIIYSFDLDDAMVVLLDVFNSTLPEITRWQKQKNELDLSLAQMKEEYFSHSERVSLLEAGVKKNLAHFDEYKLYFPMMVSSLGDGFENLLAMRSSLEALRLSLLEETGEDIYKIQIESVDQYLREVAELSWLSEGTKEDQLLTLTPLKRWWWYRRYYN